jgi:hypothetical protein
MSEFLGSPNARPRPEPDQARTLEMLATLVLVALVLAVLYVGRDVFIPIAIAILISFVLSPPILLLRRWGLARVPSVLTVVFAALVIAFLVSAVLTRQVSELAVDLRRGVLNELRHKRIMETIGEVIEDLSDHSEESPIKAPAPEPTALAAPRDISSPTALGALPDTKEPSPDLLQTREGPVLCIAGRSFLGEAAASLFAQLLEKHGMEAKVEPAAAC